MSREVQKLRRSSTLKKRPGSIKKVAPSASRMLKESRVSHVFEELKEPPAGHFFENQDDGWLSGIQVLVQHISIRGLHYDASDRGSGHGRTLSGVVSRAKGYVATYVQRSDDEVSTGPAEGEPSPSDVNWDIQVSTFSSELFLRRGDVIILSEGSFLDGLEKFKKNSMIKQRREMGEALTKVC